LNNRKAIDFIKKPASMLTKLKVDPDGFWNVYLHRQKYEKIKIISAFLFLLQFSDLKAQLFDHLEPCDVNFLSVSKDSNTKKLIGDFDEIAPYLRFVAIPTDSLSVF
jgi:hypothetical protein